MNINAISIGGILGSLIASFIFGTFLNMGYDIGIGLALMWAVVYLFTRK